MDFLLPVLFIVFMGLLLHGWWKHGFVPTVLWFHAERRAHPGTYWAFLALFAGMWCWFVGYVLRALLWPESAPHLHHKDHFGWADWAMVAMFAGSICFIAGRIWRDAVRTRLLAQVKVGIDAASPENEGWSIDVADALYTVRELRQLRDELGRMPMGRRRLSEAMTRVERDWPEA